jgi:type VI secretion system protein ImpB
MEKSEQLEIGSTHKGKRVEIYMQVEENGAIRKESIPFVVGVLAPLSGDKEGRPTFKEREAKPISRENFAEMMAEIQPELHFSVDSVLPSDPNEKTSGSSTKLGVNLTFTQMASFEPEQVGRQVPEINGLLQERKALNNLLRRIKANGKLGAQIEAALEDPGRRAELFKELGISAEG